MKLDLEIKNTLDKINRNQLSKNEYESINQKYKQLFMDGDVIDPFVGMGIDGKIYDKDMIRKEFLKKKLIYIPFIAVAIILSVYFMNITINNIYMRIKGQVIKAGFVEESRLCERSTDGISKYDGYVLLWKSSEENSMEADNPNTVGLKFETDSGIVYSGEFNTDRNRFKIGKDEFRELIDNCNPVELAIVVYPEKLKFYQEFNKNVQVNLYYLPDAGEDYLDLRIPDKLWMIIVADILIILFDAFCIWRVVKSIKEERRINRSYE